MADPYIGQIGTFAFNYAPEDWATCGGQSMLVGQNQALYAIIRNTFGGDTNAFMLPNLFGQALCGPGAVGNLVTTYATRVGTETLNIDLNHLPQHRHGINAAAVNGDPVNALSPVGNMPAQGYYNSGPTPARTRNVYTAFDPNNTTQLSPTIMNPTAPSGSPASIDNRQPFTALTFAICLIGNFPPPQQ